ncbi:MULTISPECIES: xylulokinase [Mesorhizobium]|uniref:Xylulose kinase n=1 Tax=Mesorhizobium denitrificans TaxID=2294114 RepID=A0A371X3T5_9HYPH|nr:MULTISPECIES: xylulokinase [Mesorhizobium]RFC63886.1 xylulokinase [Mesorhizobium denitrificans]
MTQALLGIDIGTSGCKALLIDSKGAVLASQTETYGLSQPKPGWTEQDPQLWIDGARKAVAGVLARQPKIEIAAIGLSGQMHGLTPLDADDKVLRPALLWNDQRNGAECAEITERAGGLEGLLAHTNNRMLVGYTGGKIVWMRNHEPELFGRMTHILNPKDYLRLVLTGEKATEVSDASGTGLFDTRARKWAGGLLDILNIDPALLPPCHESHVISGRVSKSGSELFGLPVGIPVVGGGGDSVIQTIGSGVIAPGELQTTIGTAGILAVALDEPVNNPDGRLQVFCNVAPDKWHCMGVSLNAGGAMEWLRSVIGGFASDNVPTAENLSELAADAPAGSRGLFFLPYLNGERCPHPDPSARGAFVGLTARHGASDISRAIMEGVTHSLFDIYSLMEKVGIGRKLIKASGGGARSALWRQMQADLFGCDVVTTEGAAEGGAFGAALVAGVGVGIWPDAIAAANVCKSMTRESPNTANSEALQAAFRIYAELYKTLTPSFAAIGKSGLDR